jgi:hypothetical protein
MLGRLGAPPAVRHQPIFQEGRLRADSGAGQMSAKRQALADPRSEIALRRAEIAVGIDTEQDAALEEDPENIALPSDRLLYPAD